MLADLGPSPRDADPTCESRARGLLAEHLRLTLEGPTELVFQEIALDAGSATGWHYHPGPVLVVVRSGTLTRCQADGAISEHHAGEAFVEAAGEANVHLGMNIRAVPVHLSLMYLTPADTPLAVAAEAPRQLARPMF